MRGRRRPERGEEGEVMEDNDEEEGDKTRRRRTRRKKTTTRRQHINGRPAFHTTYCFIVLGGRRERGGGTK
jgi:hypothetical protein